MTPDEEIENRSKAILFRDGKTFWFVSRFLSQKFSRDAARLYAFCRMLDDWADGGDHAGPKKLDDLVEFFNSSSRIENNFKDRISSIKTFSEEEKKLTLEFLRLGLSRPILLQLLIGLQRDTERALVEEKSELIVYAYRVAGTVGLFMAQILGAESEKAQYHAVDLGIAMQLTNVCRDVLEDARMGRRYLPSSFPPKNIAEADLKTRESIADCIRETLILADRYYESGVQGIHYLPRRCRFAVYMMAKIYRHIGVLILSSGVTWWEERVYVPIYKKIFLTLSALPKALIYLIGSNAQKKERKEHAAQLHEVLLGLPGIDK